MLLPTVASWNYGSCHEAVILEDGLLICNKQYQNGCSFVVPVNLENWEMVLGVDHLICRKAPCNFAELWSNAKCPHRPK